jgi:hypothetical protein
LLYDDLKTLLYKAFSQNYVFKVPFMGLRPIAVSGRVRDTSTQEAIEINRLE